MSYSRNRSDSVLIRSEYPKYSCSPYDKRELALLFDCSCIADLVTQECLTILSGIGVASGCILSQWPEASIHYLLVFSVFYDSCMGSDWPGHYSRVPGVYHEHIRSLC